MCTNMDLIYACMKNKSMFANFYQQYQIYANFIPFKLWFKGLSKIIFLHKFEELYIDKYHYMKEIG